MQALENPVDLLFTVGQLLVLHKSQLLELQKCLEDNADLLLYDGGEGGLVIHHESHDLDQAAQGLTCR